MCATLKLITSCLLTSCISAGACAATTGNDCAGVAGLRIADANLLAASVLPASVDLPDFCRMPGVTRPAISLEVRLPTRDWNGKSSTAGCGGIIAGATVLDYSGLFARHGAWVERGVARDSISGARIRMDGAVGWSRPVCPYSESAGCEP